MDVEVWIDGVIWLAGEWKPWSEKGRDGGFFFDCLGRIGKTRADGAFAASFCSFARLR